MKRAYSYIRFSSDKQAKGDSVRRQIALRDQWLKENGNCFLDENTIEDFGVSAAKGDNLDPRKGNLGKFLTLCRKGKIEHGSYLILERVDRFSRKSTFRVGDILRELVEDHGLLIVFLEPNKMVLDNNNIDDTMNVMTIVMALQLAHDESAKKSDRVSARWQTKKKNLKVGTIYTRKTPAWIEIDDNDKFILNKEKVKTIKLIFKLSNEGYGCKKLIRYLTDNNIPPITEPTIRKPEPEWAMSYISQLLNDRRLIGEIQPKTQRGSSRKTFDGSAIPNYFPKALDENTFNKCQVIKKQRKTYKVVKDRKFINLFVGLLNCASDGRKMTAISRNRKINGKIQYNKYLVSTGKRNGVKYCPISIEYYKFEKLMYTSLTELKLTDLVVPDRSPEDIKTIRNNIEATKDRIKLLEDKIVDDRYTSEIDSLLDAKIQAKEKLVDYQNKMDDFTTQAPVQPKDINKQLKELKKHLDDKELNHELLVKARSFIASIVDEINITPLKHNNRTYAFGEIVLKSGNKRNFILHPTFVQFQSFHDKDKNLTLYMCAEGLTWHGTNLWGDKKPVVKPYAFIKTNPKLKVKKTEVFDLLQEIDNKFQEATYHGDNSWDGIKYSFYGMTKK